MGRTGLHVLVLVSLLFSARTLSAEEDPPAPPEVVSLDRAIASTQKTPEAALKLVRDRISFRPYVGFVKGPEEAWRDGTANSEDTADLMKQVLKAFRIRSRLAFGTLSGERVTTLIRECLPAAKLLEDVDAELPGEERALPTEDPALRKVVAAHVWVQAHHGGKWIDLDPLFADLKPGVAAARATRFQPKVTPRDRRILRFEVYATEEGKPRARRLLRFERPVSSLAGRRILLVNQGINEKSRDGKPDHVTMRPILFLDGKQYPGSRFGVPAGKPGGRLGDVFGSGKEGGGKAGKLADAVVEITLAGGGRPDRKERRYLYLGGGLDRMTDFTAYHVGFGGPGAAEVGRQIEALAKLTAGAEAGVLPPTGKLTEDHEKQAQQAFDRAATVAGTLAAWLAHCADRMRPQLDEGLGVVSDATDARVLGVSIDPMRGRVSTDLIFDPATAWARKGTKLSAVGLHASLRGLTATAMEESMLASLGMGDVRSVGAVLRAAGEQKIPIVALAADLPDCLKSVAVPAFTMRILEERLAAGHLIAIPAKPVKIGEEEVVAWYEIDPATGRCVGVSGDGRHQGMTEDAQNRLTVAVIVSFCQSFYSAFDETLLKYAEKILSQVSPDMNFPLIHAQALSSLASLDMKTVKQIAKELKGKIKDLANSGALCGRAAALVMIWATIPVK